MIDITFVLVTNNPVHTVFLKLLSDTNWWNQMSYREKQKKAFCTMKFEITVNRAKNIIILLDKFNQL